MDMQNKCKNRLKTYQVQYKIESGSSLVYTVNVIALPVFEIGLTV